MTYITCEHPKEERVIKKEVIKHTDSLLKYSKPKPYCEKCNSYLPVFEEPGRSMITFFFIRQDNQVRAIPTA